MATIFDKGDYSCFFNSSILFWRAEGDGFSPGFSKSDTGFSELIFVNPSYHLGLQLFGGYRFLHSNWQASLGYMYFRSRNTSPSREEKNREIFPFWSYAESELTPFTSQQASWKLHAHLIDASLSRRFYVGQSLIFSTEIGLRSTLLDQKYKAAYQKSLTLLESITSADSFGFGPRIGILSDWFWGSGIRLLASSAVHLAYTSYCIHHKEKIGSSFPFFSIHDERSRILPVTELAIGLGWGASFLKYTAHLDISLRYDLMVLFGRNFLKSFLDPILKNFSRSNYDLYLHGFTLKLRGDF